jgi:hypothetical protein
MSLWKSGVILPAEKLTPIIVEDIKLALTPAQTVALTAWAEARSRFNGKKWIDNPPDALADVVNVVMNRCRIKGLEPKAVCLARAQFSCWAASQGRSNYESLLDRAQRLLAGQRPSDKLFVCLTLANNAASMTDTLNGATHYYSPASMVPPGRVPSWTAPPAICTTTRHGHKFFANVRW